MVEIYKWVERKFNFDFPVGLFPTILERLRGTPARIEELVAGLSRDILTTQGSDGWTIQQNAGHLLDVEALWMGRTDDFASGLETLRPADMSNTKTEKADHNAESIQNILDDFRRVRIDLVYRLEKLDIAAAAKTALHPRLKVPMRQVDSIFFAAEHDDHHLARISGLKRKP